MSSYEDTIIDWREEARRLRVINSALLEALEAVAAEFHNQYRDDDLAEMVNKALTAVKAQ